MGRDDGAFFITMEYCQGQDLKGLIRQTGLLTVPTAVGLAVQICRGLAAAHRTGLIHSDLRPENILIDRQGQVRILDFGLRRILSGAPEYTSPERAEGGAVDLRTDIYSLGIILYEMVAGHVPLLKDEPPGGSSSRDAGGRLEFDRVHPQLPEKLQRIICRCLETDREKRYPTVPDLLTDLEHIDGLHWQPPPPAFPGKTTKSHFFSNPSRPSLALMGALLVVLAVVLSSLLFFKRRDRAAPVERVQMLVVLPFENLGLPEDEYFSDGLSEEIMSRLAALKELGVISRSSAFQYKNTEKTVKEIGKELEVDFVLEGTVRWNREAEDQSRVRVTAQLIRVVDDTHLWAESYDRMIEDIFSVQTEIADQVTKNLDISILGPERDFLRENPTDSLPAYNAYLRARTVAITAYIGQSRQEYEEAIGLLNEAIRLDPDFLQAHLLHFNYQMQLYRVGLDRTEERLNGIREKLQFIEELAPDSPEVWKCRGLYTMRILRDYQRALEIFDSVQRVRPNLSPSYLADIQRLQGLERAFRINPLSSDLAHVLGRCYAWINDYRKSEEWFNRALSIFPDLYYSKLGKARLPLLSRGDTQETRLLLEMLPQHRLTDYNWFELGLLERNCEEVLGRLKDSPYDTLSEAQFYIPKDLAYAAVYKAMGERESMLFHASEAASLLEKAASEYPEDIRLCAALGLAYAYAGHREDSVLQGQKAIDLYPLSRDAFEGPRYILNLAKIYAIIGESSMALDQLEYLFSIPCGNNYSIPLLKLDPVWDSLRGQARFQKLLSRNIQWRAD
jgi:TolB-like protein